MKNILLFLVLCLAIPLFPGSYHQAIDYIFPLPDSEFLTTQTTVILRLDSAYLDDIADLSSLISVSRESGPCPGTTFWAADDRTIIFKPDEPFQNNEIINVVIATSQFVSTDFSYSFKTVERSGNVPAAVPNVDAPDYNAELQVSDYAPPRLINGVAVPGDFPTIEARQYGETAPGMIFYATNYPQEGTGNYIIICKNDGTPYFYRRYDDVVRSGNLTVHPTGVLTAHFYFKWFYVVLDHNFVEIDTIRVGHGYETDNHELQILENGHALLVARDRINVDMSQIVSGGQKSCTVEGHHFQELDREHNVIFEWRSWDHYNIADTNVGTSGGFLDYVHMNSIAIDYDGNYVISARDLNEITKIDRTTGEIIWRLNGRNNEFDFINDEPARFRYQHDFRPVPGKPNYYTIFDNGRGRNPQYSRVIEYKIDPDAKTIENVWEYRHQPDWYTSSMGSAQRLPNGNTLGDFPGGSLRVAEVNPDGELLFEFFSRGHSNYRCRRFDWTGQMQQPYLITENLGAVVRLIFNKFGDDNVKHYNIYYGTSREPDQLLASTSETYYDASGLNPNTMYYFRVTAVDQNDVESGYSAVKSGSVNYIGPGQNAVRNGAFDSREHWSLQTSDGAIATTSTKDGIFKISVVNNRGSIDAVQLMQKEIVILQNKNYTFEFDAYAGAPRAIDALVESSSSPFINFGKISSTALTTRMKHFKYTFTMEYPTDSNARVVFNCGGEVGDVYIDNVSLTYGEPEQGDSIVRINFQPADASVPDGYQADVGQSFGDRGNGFRYGWRGGDNNETRLRDYTDNRYATLNHLQKGDDQTWEIELPNGSYYLNLVMGDAGFTDQINTIQVEDVVIDDPDGEDNFDEFTTTVTVNDGRLTLRPADNADNAKLCFIDISSTTTTVDDDKGHPVTSVLFQNYPNPFNAETILSFALVKAEHVDLTIYDIRGRVVKTLVSEALAAGVHHVSFDASDLPSGVYLYKLHSASLTQVRKMMLVK